MLGIVFWELLCLGKKPFDKKKGLDRLAEAYAEAREQGKDATGDDVQWVIAVLLFFCGW